MPERYAKIAHGSIFHRVPRWGFELAIWLGLVVFGSLHVYGHLTPHPVVRVVFGALFTVLLYGSFIEPRLITVKRFAVGKGERSVTIAFLSDLHAGPYKGERWFRRLTKRTNALGADLILLGGDYIFDRGADAPLLTPLAGLRASLGVFGMLGNHDDHYDRLAVERQFAAMKIPLLVNASVRFPERHLAVAGLEDDWYFDARPDQATAGIQPDDTFVLLAHNPELAVRGTKDMPHKPALMFSGHDHGGQIRLPFIGSLARMPHHLGQHFDRGQFDIGGVSLIIGQGVGESGPRARLFCPPQIVLVTLRY